MALARLFPFVIAAVAIVATAPATAQPTTERSAPPTSEPATTAPAAGLATTQPAPIENPLKTPYRSLQRFITTMAQVDSADEDQAAVLRRQAMACLDFGDMDLDTQAEKGPERVAQLYDVLNALIDAGVVDPEDRDALPDETQVDGDINSFGQPPLVLVLARVPRQITREGGNQPETIHEWRFSPRTVAELPRWHANLADLVREATTETPVAGPDTPTPGEGQPLRSPHHTVTYFLDRAREAREVDTNYYKDAYACIDFSGAAEAALQAELKLEDPAEAAARFRRQAVPLTEQFIEKNGIPYVDNLAKIIEMLRASGKLELDKLPRELPPEHKPTYVFGTGEFELQLLRQPDGRWVFGASTVRQIPAMAKRVDELAAADAASATAKPAAAPSEPAAVTVPGPVAATPTGESPIRVRSAFRSPRATVRTFRRAIREGDLDTAARCLDLSGLSVTERELKNVLAGKLWLVMTRYERVSDSAIPAAPDGDPFDLLTRIEGRIELDRQWAEGREGEWLFTPRTVGKIEALYDKFEDEPIDPSWAEVGIDAANRGIAFATLPSLYIREYWLPQWIKVNYLGLELWQWLGVAALLIAGALTRFLLALLLPPVGWRLMSSKQVTMLPRVLKRATLPLATLAMLGLWWQGALLLDLPQTPTTWLNWLLKILTTVAAVLAAYRIIDLLSAYFAARAAASSSRVDDVVVPLIDKTLKVLAIALGLIFLLNVVFGIDGWRLVAGLGVGGLAVAFAAQDTIRNFFGSINVVLDRPFQVGDWVIINGVEGTVDAVGLRSTRIRTFYKSQVTIPNSEIMNATIDNMQRRPVRRFKAMIGVTYDTKPTALEAFTEGIRELVRRHPLTHKDAYHVYINAFGPSSIDILLYIFFEAKTWAIELEERQRMIVDIVRLAHSLGVEFAFPTQTLHLYKEEAQPGRMDHVPGEIPAALELGRKNAGDVVDRFLPTDLQRPKQS